MRPASGQGDFPAKLLMVAGLVAAALLVVRLSDVVLMAFGAVLVAILLHAAAEPLVKSARLPRALALAAAVLGLSVMAGATLWFFGREAGLQITALGELIPNAWTGLEAHLSRSPIGAYVLEDLRRLRHADGLLVELGPRLIRDSASAAAATVIVLFAGLYLAFHPGTYLRAVLGLIPRRARTRAEQVLQGCGRALNRWLIGQFISMVLVGVTTGVGLWIAGVPSPLGLGVIAGLGQFVPVLGPMASAIPGLVIAAGEGTQVLLWTVVIYAGAMQLEANVVTPLLLRQMVELPMAVTLFAVLAMGVLLGPLGVLFATPLAVVAHVVVRMVYVEGVLGETASPSEPGGEP